MPVCGGTMPYRVIFKNPSTNYYLNFKTDFLHRALRVEPPHCRVEEKSNH